MNEARRFLRYIFPGMIFFILLSLYLFISARGQLLKAVKGFMQGAGGGGGVLQAGVFILFVAGVGYFFATIYHSISKINRLRLPNPSGLLKDAQKKEWVVVINRSKKDDIPFDIDKKYTSTKAWSILGAYYHARIHVEKFRDAHVRIESLNDTLHGLGASAVASIASLLAWIPLHNYLTGYSPICWLCYLLFFLVSCFMFLNYILTGQEAERFIDGITSQFMAEESCDGAKPISLYFRDKPSFVEYMEKWFHRITKRRG
jgi:hypothetical protein